MPGKTFGNSRRSLLRTAAVAVLALSAVLIPTSDGVARGAITDDVDLEIVAGGLSLAVDLAAPPGDNRLFVVEKVGRIRIIKNGTVLSTPFLDITGPVRSTSNEQGLLGLAFPADYAQTGLFYVHYTSDAGSGDTAIAEYRVSADPDVADASSGRVLFTTNQPNTNHNGGSIQVGPDGFLYAGLGDGGGGGDPGENGQNKNTTLGSIIRLDPATGNAAPGNPFIDAPGADEIWHYGLRNPWRFSFDAATGDMYIGDVGQGELEEVDLARAGESGLNFGWDAYEGTECFEGPCSPSGLTFPVTEYGHRAGGACGGSITGGYVYRGNDLPSLRGHYFYADWCHGDLKSFRMKGDSAVDHTNWTNVLGAPGFITSFGQDGFGELYFLAQGNVYKFVSTSPPVCDFNGDGHADVPVGVPGEGVSGSQGAGRVVVFDGFVGDIDPGDNTVFKQGSDGLNGAPEPDDRFGFALACGDFDHDGYADLGIGSPYDGAGTVHVVYGGPSGLTGSGSDFWTQANLGVGAAAQGDLFGFALAAGDLNRDGYDDLVVGAPGDNESGAADSGSVAAIFGSASGLTPTGAKLLHQGAAGIKDDAAAGDGLGHAVAVGDVDGDGFGDIVAGAPGERVGGLDDAGAIQVFFGKKLGIGPRDSFVHRNTAGIVGKPAAGAHFGSAVATGSLDIDGFDDIAVGVSRADSAGAVHVIHGGPGDLSDRDDVYRQGAGGIAGFREAGDEFGAALATGDTNGDGYDDLAIGAPGEGRGGTANTGMVGVILGSASGLDRASYMPWHRSIAGVKGPALANDRFGAALGILDTRADGRLDLVVGVPQLNEGGEIQWLPGHAFGISTVGNRRWHQGTPGVPGFGEPLDSFGGAL